VPNYNAGIPIAQPKQDIHENYIKRQMMKGVESSPQQQSIGGKGMDQGDLHWPNDGDARYANDCG
jgi:hypothetical protein